MKTSTIIRTTMYSDHKNVDCIQCKEAIVHRAKRTARTHEPIARHIFYKHGEVIFDNSAKQHTNQVTKRPDTNYVPSNG